MKLPHVLATLLLGAAATLVVAAEEPPANAGRRQADDQLLKKISLDLVDAEPGQVFATFGELAGWRIDLDAGVKRKLSIRLHSVTLRTALTAVCESVDCRWELEGGTPPGGTPPGGTPPTLRIRPLPGEPTPSQSAPPRTRTLDEAVDLELLDAPAGAVFASFGSLLGAEVSLDPSLEARKISIEVHRKPVREVLDSLCQQVGCAWQLTGSPGAQLRISAKP